MELIKKKQSSQTEFCWKQFIYIQLADYLTKHSMFLFEIKQRTPPENTGFVTSAPKVVDYDFIYPKWF